MRLFTLDEIRPALQFPALMGCMREALIAYSRGECDTPMPMHLDITERDAEVHIKSSYRHGGRYYALKIAATFPRNASRGLPAGNGMMLLCSAETGQPVAYFDDCGHLTDVRTAAVAAMTARELGRRDRVVGIMGTGIQARLSAIAHAELLGPEQIVIWGRDPEHAEQCASELRTRLPRVALIQTAASPGALASAARLIVTCTASREPLLLASKIQPGTHISAIGSDSPGKRELEPAILRRAALVLADSRQQCEKLGELQHAPDLWGHAVEIGAYCLHPREVADGGITVADFTGLGAEDLFIAEYTYERLIPTS